MWEYIMTLWFLFFGQTIEICIPVSCEVAETTREKVKGSRAFRAFCMELFHRTHVRSATLVPVGDLGRCTLIHRLHR